jgi:hypothetical protein
MREVNCRKRAKHFQSNQTHRMKGEGIMFKSLWSTSLFVVLVAIAMVLQPDETVAQRRVIVTRHRAEVARLPRERTRVVVAGKEFFYSRGVFYRSGPKGYVTVAAPSGARIRVLPVGYVTIRIGAIPYYYYYGTYYQFDPASKVYTVVSPPAGASPQAVSTLDKMELVDGRTLEGTFIGGTKSTVQFEVDGAVQEIPIDQIISIVFAPPSD